MKWLLLIVTISLILATLFIIAALFYNRAYADKFFPGVTLNGQSLKNLKPEQAQKIWQDKIDEFTARGLKYRFNSQETVISPAITGLSPDAAYTLADFDLDQTINRAYLIGRNHGYTRNALEQLAAAVFGKNINLTFQLRQDELLNILKDNFAAILKDKEEARPEIKTDLSVAILPETNGTTLNYGQLIAESQDRLAALSSEPINLKLQIDEANIKQSEITEDLVNQLKERLNEKITLTSGEKKWVVPVNIFKDWLAFAKENSVVSLSLNEAEVLKYLDTAAKEIDRPALDAKFNVANGRVTEFQGSQDGQELDREKTLAKIKQDWLLDKQANIELAVKTVKSKIATASVNDLGIAALLGTGQSNYKGSPKNRRANIKVGADSLNGVLIKPGETFSLIAALGEIDAAHGYLPELVIKGDKTTPEFGGGLCQIGTTVFRAALSAGLPIMERRNHSYRVVYYEPAGKDATIYSPRPDLKFTNDTPNYILIQARIEGDDLYFDFWGTKDGRIISQSDSTIYNIRSAGPVINIETDALKPGQKKCTETAHAGADAYFDYAVTYPGGEVKKERFSSHYIPWPAKCLIGREPAVPTSTPEIIQ
ncbi:MAG: VanW family protein [Candidatus Komeilibacteria bacterium]|nr:VanW family protein [Candidatus Komeilibacteria bacterium]